MNTLMNRTAAFLLACGTLSCGAPEQKIRVRVTDDQGQPVKDAPCTAGWWKDNFIHGHTDATGQAEFTGRTGFYESFVKAEVPGYYMAKEYRHMMTQRNGDHWEPWPVEVNLVLKRMVRPHPMFVCENGGKSSILIPEKRLDHEFGYDLIERDWVQPYGKGKTADFRITTSLDTPGDTQFEPHGSVTLKFTNPQDGIIEYPNAATGGSLLQGPHEAPETGYRTEWKYVNWNATPPAKGAIPWSPSLFVFRVRSVVDTHGHIASARYGKLMGILDGGLYYRNPKVYMTYYLNGTDNDRGLEWDMKNNLFKDLEGDMRNWGKP